MEVIQLMESYEAERISHQGLTIRIVADQHAESPGDWEDDTVFIVTTSNRYFEQRRDGFSLDDIRDSRFKKDYHALPLFMYAHSGVSLSLGQFSCPWDSGQVGYCMVKKRQGLRNIRKAAQFTVEAWNQYLSGDVWGFVIEDESGNDIDSCWGFYGLEYCKQEAIEAANSHLAYEAKQVPVGDIPLLV